MYCLCSDRSFDAILALQRARPLPLDQMIECYTACRSGCGSCIEALRAEAIMRDLVPGSTPVGQAQEA